MLNCENNKVNKKDIMFSVFLFLKDIELRNKWLQFNSNINGKITRLSQRICEKHFHPNDIHRFYLCWQNEFVNKNVSAY